MTIGENDRRDRQVGARARADLWRLGRDSLKSTRAWRHIEAELPKLWDLRRRLEAAKAAGLDGIPIPPPPTQPADRLKIRFLSTLPCLRHRSQIADRKILR